MVTLSQRESQGIVYWHKEMERICIDTLHSLFYGYPSMRVPPESRMVVKRFPSRHPLPLPVGEVAERSEDGEGK